MKTSIDRQHIWHPYSSITNPHPMFAVESASGVRIKLADGRELIDGMASWWCVIHGYNHPVLNQAIIDQTQKMAHVMFGGLTHEPAIALTETLINITPEPLQHVFYSDSGSVAVEVAIKMALQYWQALGQPKKNRLLSLRKGYHGDTFMTMSTCDPQTGMHHLFNDVLREQLFTQAPQCGYHDEWDESYIADFLTQVEQHQHELAAVILEPIVQGAGGMRFYSPHYLRRVREICDDYGLLLIADEIATGFGRTGELFACHHAGISPDILCLGKSLTGGYMTLAATLCTQEVGKTVCSGEAGVLMHGPTFMANPLACAVANASIELLLNSPWQARIHKLEESMRALLAECQTWPQVADVRVLGAIGVIELKKPVELRDIQGQFVDEGVWIRPFGKLVYIMPPFVMNSADLQQLIHAMKTVISRL